MPELPGRPDLDQLRRQARELLRAAAAGEPRAVTRLHAVSDRVMLSAAQLAVAREYGYSSWSRLRAEVARRRSSGPGASPPVQNGGGRGSLDAPEEGWSFGGGTAIETAEGVLAPGALFIRSGHAFLDATLTLSAKVERGRAKSGRMPTLGMRFRPLFSRRRPRSPHRPELDDVAITDDRGARYTLGVDMMGGAFQRSGEAAGPLSLNLGLDPVPERGVGWLELRGQGDSSTRLLASSRAAAHVGPVTPVAASPAERELLKRAYVLIELQLATAGEAADMLSQWCSEALTRTAELQRSGELDAASELPGQLARLCAALTEHRPADRLPADWSGMLDAAHRTDGPRHHLDIGAALPPVDGIATQLDSLISGPGSWQVYLRAAPGWWSYSERGRRRWPRVSVHAEDDLAGRYVSNSGDGTGHGDPEELALGFLPRLDPLARSLRLTLTAASEEVAVDLGLVARSEGPA